MERSDADSPLMTARKRDETRKNLMGGTAEIKCYQCLISLSHVVPRVQQAPEFHPAPRAGRHGIIVRYVDSVQAFFCRGRIVWLFVFGKLRRRKKGYRCFSSPDGWGRVYCHL